MTYTAYDVSKPNPATQAGTAELDSSRYNMQALRDALAANGTVQGFNYAWNGGTADAPTTIYFKRSTEVVKLSLTYSSGRVSKIAYYYASNETHASFPASTNGTYDPMADASGNYVETYTYDGSGYLTSSSWGSTP